MKLDPNTRCYSYVRFSSSEQASGDSLRRQIDMSEQWAQRHGLRLDANLRLADLGTSAFRGSHRKKGSLGKFFTLIEEGKIPTGSILVVESLDRLSREGLTTAFSQFLQIIEAGVRIVTLCDEILYDRDTINSQMSQLMYSIVLMANANQESVKKQWRLQAAWKNKRANAKEKVLTSLCPLWLECKADDSGFTTVPSRVSIVQSIYQSYINGKGCEAIARDLNRSKIAPWRSKTAWRKSYIRKILRNRAVLGEFQPHRMVDGRREPEGPAIENYFPQIIEPAVFYSVQRKLQLNVRRGGRTGAVNNLFGTLAKCAYCSSPMAFESKGNAQRKGGPYLCCDRARMGAGCIRIRIQYGLFEQAFLKACSELSMEDIFREDSTPPNLIKGLELELQTAQSELEALERRIGRLVDSLGEDDSETVRRVIKSEIDKRELELAHLRNKLDGKSMELQNARVASTSIDAHLDVLRLFNTECEQANSSEKRDIRLRVRSRIRELVKEIRVYPGNLDPSTMQCRRPTDSRYQEIPEPAVSFRIEFHQGGSRTIQAYGSEEDLAVMSFRVVSSPAISRLPQAAQ